MVGWEVLTPLASSDAPQPAPHARLQLALHASPQTAAPERLTFSADAQALALLLHELRQAQALMAHTDTA